MASDVTELTLQREIKAQQFLIQASAELDASLDFETTLSNVANLALPYLADWCIIALVERDGSIRRIASAHVDPKKSHLLEEFQRRYSIRPDSDHPMAEVIRSGVSQLNPDVADERMERVAPDESHKDMVRELGMTSSMIVPLRARGGTIGGISFMRGAGMRGARDSRYDAADLRLAEDLARRAALAVDNARLFQAAQEALALRDEFLAAASHDLKGPLATIKGLAQLMTRFVKRDPIDRDRVLEGLETIDASTNKMTSLINQLLDISRVEMGHPIDLDLRTTDIVALAERVVKDQRYAADRHRMSLKTDEPKFTGTWDPERIERVLTNLVSNAVKYSQGEGEITVHVRRATPEESPEDAVAVEVRDHGVGIPTGDLPRIFDHFHRAKNVRDRVRGSGIGLASVRQIVTQHGGQVLVQSEEGHGSTFTVVLPFEPPDEEEQ